MQALEPQRTGQGRGQQEARALQPAKETVQKSAVHRFHNLAWVQKIFVLGKVCILRSS